ncbi:MAG: Tn7 transposase TnsA N-terminal domain-containing protein [Clostridiales bacterium]|nr:Tn7 transposase TnsA N-terminal domain-containing protein [Clostridiales bacterium]
MVKKNYKGRCVKKSVSKSKAVCRTYSDIQLSFLDMLENCSEVAEIWCNVPLDGLEIGEYSTDFVCVKSDGDLMVRECVNRKLLLKPMTVRLLDASLEYWRKRGIQDWGLVIDAEK